MAKADEVSSTERLLEVIRGDEADGSTLQSSPAPLPPLEPKKGRGGSISIGKKTSVGVDIGYNDMKLIKIKQPFDRNRSVLAHKTVPFDPEIPRDSPEFSEFLRAVIRDFCGWGRKVKIWCVISAAMVEIRPLRVAKVAKSKLADVIYISYKKEAPFEDDEMIFDFEALQDVIEDGIKKTEVIAYTAPREDIEELTELFEKAGYPLAGITTVPFAIQNFFRSGWLSGDNESVCSLYIGRNWSRIDLFLNGNIVLSRGIKAGMNSMIEAIREELNERQSGITLELNEADEGISLEPDEETEEPKEFDNDAARKILIAIIAGSSHVSDSEPGVDISEGEIFEIITPALDRLIRQLERTLEHFVQNISDRPISRIFIQGLIGDYQHVVNHIRDQLSIPVETIDPFMAEPTADISEPETGSRSMAAFAPALGLALSDNSITPNFTYTYLEKNLKKSGRRISGIAALVVFAILAAFVGSGLYQRGIIQVRTKKITRLEKQLAKFQPVLNKEMVSSMAGKVKDNRKILANAMESYRSLAIFKELSSVTPSNIRILDVTVVMGDNGEPGGNKFTLNGVVNGDPLAFESSLADYLVKLAYSTTFQAPKVTEKVLRNKAGLKGNEILLFTAKLQLL